MSLIPANIISFYKAGFMLVLACGYYQAAVAEPIPNTFSASYSVKSGMLKVGETTRALRPTENGGYVYESYTKTSGIWSVLYKGKIREISSWHYVNGGLRPDSYVYKQSRGKDKRLTSLSFDWEKNTVTDIITNKKLDYSLPDGAQDQLLLHLSLMHDLLNNKQEMEYPIIGRRKLRTYHFVVDGEEAVKTPLGTLNTVVVRRTNDDKQTVIWCAKDFYFLPVRIEQLDKHGKPVKMMINEINGL